MNTKNKIRLILTDDHPMVLKGLKNMLSAHDDIEIVATFTNGKDLIEGISNYSADLILLDLMMPEMQGDEVVKRINKLYPELKIIILSNHSGAIYVNNMINLGVNGYLTKTVDDGTLYQAICSVIDGQVYIEPELLEKVERLNEGIKRTVALKFTLTAREKEVLQLIVDGNSNIEIAQLLFLSTHTIDTYRDSLMLKLEAKNTAALVKTAIQNELVRL